MKFVSAANEIEMISGVLTDDSFDGKNFKNYISILTIANYRTLLDASPFKFLAYSLRNFSLSDKIQPTFKLIPTSLTTEPPPSPKQLSTKMPGIPLEAHIIRSV